MNNVQQQLEAALAALQQGRLDESSRLLDRVLRSVPRSVDALHLKSMVRKQSGDAAGAEALMKKALGYDPRRADIRANLGNLYASLGRREEALAAYRAALETSPSFRPARIALARLLLAAGDVDAAIAEAKTLLDQNAGDAEAHNVLGSAYRAAGRDDEAEAAYREALRLAPGYLVARHNLGALLAQLSRSEEAVAELDRAHADGLGGPELAHNRASALMALGEFESARAVLEAGLDASPAAVNLHGLLARLRYMEGDPGFTARLTAAIDQAPENASLRVACSQLLRGAEDLDAALDLVGEAARRDDAPASVLAEMSAVHHDRGEFEAALNYANAAVAADPALPELNDLVIQAHLSLGDGAAAMPLIEAARRRAPLDQFYIALEASAARLTGDARYEKLYDYERLVRPFELPVPRGWSSIEAFHADLVPVLRDRHRFVAPPLDQSLRAGTQTPRGLLGDPDPTIKAFLDAIRAPIDAYCEHMGTAADHPLSARNTGSSRLIGCWSVRLSREGFHVNHVHSEGWISSAYYVEVPPEVEDPARRSGWIKFGEPKFRVPGATPEKFVQPAAGTLVLFPSYMWHGTTPIHGDEPRMTIAFDVVPRTEK